MSIPNAPSAVILGINPAGTALVGVYKPDAETDLGFLYQNQTTQPLQFSGSNNTAAFGVNKAGEVVGWFIDALGNTHGFTWTAGGEAKK